ncbi:MAG: hypothetical protein M3N47_05465 [Chloroflexota bacterium]|nr:hypothetical protein [Chloroflexota bacterium]
MASALDPLAVELLLALLDAPHTEAELLALLPSATQATVNRRLDRLRDAGILVHEAGRNRAPGRAWSVRHLSATEALLNALFALAEAIDARERENRNESRRKLRQARASRRGMREASDEEAG